jgi:putative phosphoesterase
MKLAVISDIHANIHALQAVWKDIKAVGPEAVYCLGDLVGYGAYPNETIDFIRKKDIPTVMGNYDEGVGFDLHDCGCVYKDPVKDQLGKKSLKWTQAHTNDENKDCLRKLDLQIRIEFAKHDILFVHGSPRKINEYIYEDRPQATFERIAKVAGTEVLLFGHTHLPYTKRVSGVLFVNAGSVGKPKDGNPDAGYVILELGRKIDVVFKRVPYNLEAASKAIRACDLPDEFADMLKQGRG